MRETRTFPCQETGELCQDSRCKRDHCYPLEQAAIESKRLARIRELDEENEIRLEAIRLVKEKLRQMKSKLRFSDRYVEEQARKPKVLALARKTRAADLKLGDIEL